jgi:ferredoxin-NADP reductase
MAKKEVWSRYLVQDIIDNCEDVRSYVFSFGLTRLRFEPGQFVVVKNLKTNTKAPLSISTSPLAYQDFELTVKRTGEFGTAFYDSVEVGDMVEMTLPSGPFVLPTDGIQPLVLVGRDYTVPAYRSYFRTLADSGIDRPVTLYHEVSSSEQILYIEDFQSARAPSFRRVVLPGEIQADRLAQHKGSLFFLSGEGVDVKRWERLAKIAGIDNDDIVKERWS